MDTSNPIGLIKAILPKVPLMGKTTLYHTLGLTETSHKWDLRTELIVNVLRSFMTNSKPEPISKTQRLTLKDPGIKGKMWISKVTAPKPPEDDIRQELFKVIEALKEPGATPGGFTEPELLPVEAEWTGYRAGATKNSPELRIPEAQKYAELMKEVTSPITILYFHGGALYLMDPCTHRVPTSKLAKLTSGRVYSVRYRLAPQNPFPAAPLDALLSYLTLLYPPEGSLHTPVDPKHIVISGDSAGGNISVALLQTLLELRRQNLKILFHGIKREIPLPAGVACNSGWFDITHSSSSCEANGKFDYLPAPSVHPNGPQYPSDSIWPVDPPRKNLYAEDAMLTHPLVSPIAARNWEGSCPLWIETGQELLSDEDKCVAAAAARQGVKVVFEEFEAMPHCFAMIFTHLEGSRRCFDGWVDFIKAVVERPESVQTKGTLIRAGDLKEEEVDVLTLAEFTDEEMRRRMRGRVSNINGRQEPDPLAKL